MSFFGYQLPLKSIAQRPLARGESRLLIAKKNREDFAIYDSQFLDVVDCFSPGDLLVLNNSKVLPCRFFLELEDGREIEVLLLRPTVNSKTRWEALARPMKFFGLGQEVMLSPNLKAVSAGRVEESKILLDLFPLNQKLLEDVILEEGHIPIPPYIRDGRSDELDRIQYQTEYAELFGSVAAPTAGLHFSRELLNKIEAQGVEIRYITHHVGPASFLPVRGEDWKEHKLQSEQYFISKSLAESILKAKQKKRRIVAVGTTSVRALESFWVERLCDQWVHTQLYIVPNYEFKVINAMFTNFHQPQSTHLLLVAAFIGEKETEQIYSHALKNNYRFLSYGDASFLETAQIGAES